MGHKLIVVDEDADDDMDMLPSAASTQAMTTEVWALVDFGRARYLQAADAIAVLLQAAAILSVGTFQKGDQDKTNREIMQEILKDAIVQAERVRGLM